MGPTNVALVKLFQADQQLREAQGRLDATSRSVRIQERKVNDLAEKLKLAQVRHRELQAKAGQFELELKSRDAHIEKLRTQQQTAQTNKEYQTFLVEINTQKVDRGKIEDEAMKGLEAAEKAGAEAAALTQQTEAERSKLAAMSAQIGDAVAKLKAEVEALRPAREAAAAAVPPRARAEFERLAERYEGEALSAVARPDRRREEYLCTSCNMDLVADVYNKLHSRDEIVFCPSCRRMLYIPEDLPPEAAVNPKVAKPTFSAEPRATRGRSERVRATKAAAAAGVTTEPRAKGELGELLTAAQGESVRAAVKLGMTPVDVQVVIDGKMAGEYKCQDPGHLERIIRYRMNEIGRPATIEVLPKSMPAEGGADAAPAEAQQDGDAGTGGAETVEPGSAETAGAATADTVDAGSTEVSSPAAAAGGDAPSPATPQD